MVSLKRAAANLVEQAIGAHVVPTHRLAERHEVETLRRLFEAFSVDCVFDIGANAGQFALKLRQSLRFAGPIISYEPVPGLAAQLGEMARRDTNWFIRQVALDSKAGSATFNVSRDTQFSSLHEASRTGQELFSEHIAIADQVVVQTETLAAELTYWRQRLGFEHPYLKIDTQGHDLTVAESAGELLSEFVVVQTEVAFKKLYRGAAGIDECIAFYESRGFALSAILPNNEGAFPLMLEADCIFVRSPRGPGDAGEGRTI
jgi:FkbM family methyltransferase